MKKFAKIMLIALGFGLVTLVLGFLTSNPRPAHAAPVAHVIVTNTPLPIQGSVNANVTGTVSVSNFPPTQTVVQVNGDIAVWLVLNFQGTFNNGTTDIYTTSQQMRVYTDDTAQPPAAAVVQSNGVQPFFAEIDISGYLVPKS